MSLPKIKWATLPWRPDPKDLSFISYIKDADGNSVFDVRGWGRLTGKGMGALGLGDDAALEAQKQVVQHVIDLVNGYAIPRDDVKQLIKEALARRKNSNENVSDEEIISRVFADMGRK